MKKRFPGMTGITAMRWYWLAACTLFLLAQGCGLLSFATEELAVIAWSPASFLRR